MGVKEDIMLEEQFKFDLQLFADETADNTPDDLEQPLEDSNESNDEFDFGIDENGQIVFRNASVFGEGLDDEEQPQEEDSAPPAPELYTVTVGGQEMEVSLEELLYGYMRNEDYTRKTQALADERRAFEASMHQPQPQYQQPQVQPQPTPEPQPEFTQRDYYEQLTNYAKEQVQNVFGEEFDEFNPVHNAALADAVATVKAQVYEQQRVEAEKARMEQSFNDALAPYTNDPNFAQIDALALQKLNEMPYAQAVQIKEALERKDPQIMGAYYAAVTNEFYGRNNVPTITPKRVQRPAPPYVEPTGAANVPPEATTRQIDYSKLGKLSTDQQARLVRELGFLK